MSSVEALRRAEGRIPAPEAASVAASSSGAAPVAYHGSAVASGDFNADGIADTVVASVGHGVQGISPRSGRALVYYGGAVPSAPGVVLAGDASPMARFGDAMSVLDFNIDGIDDLVVGAPGWSGWNTSHPEGSPFPLNGEPTYRTHGRVFVYLGHRTSGLLSGAPIVLSTAAVFAGLGTWLGAGDVSGDGHADLILGSPMADDYDGRVAVLASSSARLAGTVLDVDVPGVAVLELTGKASGSDFGASRFGAAAAVLGAPAHTLLVGAPYSREEPSCSEACAIVGRVYGFDLAALSRSSVGATAPAATAPAATASTATASSATAGASMSTAAGSISLGHANTSAASFSVAGVDPLGLLGASLATTEGLYRSGRVAIGVPGAGGSERTGKLAILGETAVLALRGELSLANLSSIATVISGDAAQGRLGSTLLWADLSAAGAPGLLATAPLQDAARHFPSVEQREVGGLFFWTAADLPSAVRGGSAAPIASVSTATVTATATASWVVQGQRSLGRLGASVALVVQPAPNRSCVLAGSPRASVRSPFVMQASGAADVLCWDGAF